jgi:hypothetical protein
VGGGGGGLSSFSDFGERGGADGGGGRGGSGPAEKLAAGQAFVSFLVRFLWVVHRVGPSSSGVARWVKPARRESPRSVALQRDDGAIVRAAPPKNKQFVEYFGMEKRR